MTINTPLSAERLAEIKARYDKERKRWTSHAYVVLEDTDDPNEKGIICFTWPDDVPPDDADMNARCMEDAWQIANDHNRVPELLAEVDRLREQAERDNDDILDRQRKVQDLADELRQRTAEVDRLRGERDVLWADFARALGTITELTARIGRADKPTEEAQEA